MLDRHSKNFLELLLQFLQVRHCRPTKSVSNKHKRKLQDRRKYYSASRNIEMQWPW